MKNKIVYSYNESGEYIGESIAWESPLEPGIYHIPANATDIKPAINPGEISKWNGKKWINEQIPELPKETTEQKKARLKNEKITPRKVYLENSLKEAMEYLIEGQEYPQKSKRELAKQEIEEIKISNTISALNQFSDTFE